MPTYSTCQVVQPQALLSLVLNALGLWQGQSFVVQGLRTNCGQFAVGCVLGVLLYHCVNGYAVTVEGWAFMSEDTVIAPSV